ncbi:MAG: Mrr cat protein [Candidatus Hydrogenedentes bacterium]|nr:Mrr cat protein [Candidatus Hydrogenedentota bacterium]
MTSERPLESQVTELYRLLGHEVKEMLHRDASTTDLVIKTDGGKRWLARCIKEEEVDAPEIERFIKIVKAEDASQCAIVTTGVFTPAAKAMKEKNRFLIDGNSFRKYLAKAREINSKPAEDAREFKPVPVGQEPKQHDSHFDSTPLIGADAIDDRFDTPPPLTPEEVEAQASAPVVRAEDIFHTPPPEPPAPKPVRASHPAQIQHVHRDSKEEESPKPAKKRFGCAGMVLTVLGLGFTACWIALF